MRLNRVNKVYRVSKRLNMTPEELLSYKSK